MRRQRNGKSYRMNTQRFIFITVSTCRFRSRTDVFFSWEKGRYYSVPDGTLNRGYLFFYRYLVPIGTFSIVTILLNENKKMKSQIFDTPPVRVLSHLATAYCLYNNHPVQHAGTLCCHNNHPVQPCNTTLLYNNPLSQHAGTLCCHYKHPSQRATPLVIAGRNDGQRASSLRGGTTVSAYRHCEEERRSARIVIARRNDEAIQRKTKTMDN